MISRRTTLLIADIICNKFTHTVRDTNLYGKTIGYSEKVKEEELRNFLFEFNVDGFTIDKICHGFNSKAELKKNILNMHTGYFYSKTNYHKFVQVLSNFLQQVQYQEYCYATNLFLNYILNTKAHENF